MCRSLSCFDFLAVALWSHWVRSSEVLTRRAGKNTWRVHLAGKGEICFSVIPVLSKSVLVSAVTHAWHGTDHNDLLLSCSGVLMTRKWKGAEKKGFGRAWVKAYQHIDPSMWYSRMCTVDHNPQLIYIEVLENIAHLCVSGRSSKFTVHQVRLPSEQCV